MAGQGTAVIAVFFVIAFITALGLQGYKKYSEERALAAFRNYVHEARQLAEVNRPPPPTADIPLPKGYIIRLSGPYAELLKDGTVAARDLYSRWLLRSDFEQGREGWHCSAQQHCYWRSGSGYADKGYLYLSGSGEWAVAYKSFVIQDTSDIRKITLSFAWNPVFRPSSQFWNYLDFRIYLQSNGSWRLLKRGYCTQSRWGFNCWGVQANGGWQEVELDITPYLGKNMAVFFYERSYPSSSYLLVDNVAVAVDFGRR